MPADFPSRGAAQAAPEEAAENSKPPWIESFFDLVGARIELVQLEAKQLAAQNIGRIVMIVAAALAACVAWLLLMASIIGILTAFTPLAWYWSSLVMACIHLLATAALLRAARSPAAPAFELTRSEFTKDREWFQNFQQTKHKP